MSGLQLNDAFSHLYVQGPKWEYRNDPDDPYTGYYIPARVISLLRPGRDLVVLPGNSAPIREFARFSEEILGLTKDQMLYTSGRSYQVQRDARLELIDELHERTSPESWMMIPYAVSYSTNALAHKLKLRVLGDARKLVRRVGTKAILHPNAIPELRPAGLPLLTDEIRDIRVPRGYLATTLEEIAVAREKLKQEGIGELVLKPALGSAGEGIQEVNEDTDLRSYSFPLGPVLLEEKCVIDLDSDGNVIAPSIQYINGSLGKPTDQIIRGSSHAGNRFPSRCDETFQQEFLALSKSILAWAGTSGPGGFDVLSVQGKPVLIDINLGRWTGAHPSMLFRERFAPGSCCKCWKFVPTTDSSVWEYWNKLHRHGVALTPHKTKTGVYPICYLPGMWALIGAFGSSPKEVEWLTSVAQSI